MKHFAKLIRVITIAPFAATILNLSVYFSFPGSFESVAQLIYILLFTAILPVMAYPIQKVFHIIKIEDQRNASRVLAIILSVISYSAGVVFCLLAKVSEIQQIIYFTYFFSGLAMLFLNLIFRVKASGHLCGITGPVTVMIWFLGIQYLPLILLSFLVGWSSIKLKRHELRELIIGFFIPVIAMLISIFFVGI